jgi:hypothetical protein
MHGVVGGVVSLRRVQGWEDTRILSPFSDWRLVRVPLGLELLRLGFFSRLYALSLYVFSGILPMSPSDDQVFVMSFSDNEHVCPPLPFPFCSTKPWKWGRRGIGSLICCLWYPCVYKKILCEEQRQSIKNLEIFLVYSLCGYYCEPSQRTGNRLVVLYILLF